MPILVILDLDGTIVDSTHKKRPNAPPPDFRARTKFVYYRPGMQKFLGLLFSNPDIRVGVWTSCKRENALSITEHIFGAPNRWVDYVFSREDCVLVPGPGFKTIKDLEKTVWSQYTQWGPENTIVVDDSSDKLARQPKNLFKVSTFIAGSSDHSEPLTEKHYHDILALYSYISANNENTQNL